MQPSRPPYFIDYGEYRGFRYFQSDRYYLRDLLRYCPKLWSHKWAIMTAFDYSEFLPPGNASLYNDYNDNPFRIESFSDYPSSGNGDEFYYFDEYVDVASLSVLSEIQPFDEHRLSEIDLSTLDKNWSQLEQVKATGYTFDGAYHTYIFKSDISVQKFLVSEFVKRTPLLHLDEEAARIRALRNPERGPGKCARKNCRNTRVKYGVNCPRHHYEMLNGKEVVKEIFDDPLPGDSAPLSVQPPVGIDRWVAGVALLLALAFILVFGCFIWEIIQHGQQH